MIEEGGERRERERSRILIKSRAVGNKIEIAKYI